MAILHINLRHICVVIDTGTSNIHRGDRLATFDPKLRAEIRMTIVT